ncbi:hypothetical protein SDRG_13900 [Saprolegnia diclina VS20]|uniref:Uncharacterized protein n=1 Tax=Saprolegnia diclina (strain VS20) TaxID=1156394 RepID=T0R8F5_SAPDV|nr:hypothetical protein SDRG_13900 [Saprolegnia diclina VS20]EQC28353.1 hypothetical protein SDRG_13900 [Saprolegnia diclina VS20]|eukprot:XP_008618223.1 hypothetical protein SDRG_13900 [Saprolegnia diclina VS20]
MMDEADAAALKRRVNRDKKRAFRHKVQQQLDFLRRRVSDLEADLSARLAPTALPWAEVARALRDDVTEGEAAQRVLMQQLARQQHLALLMARWVDASVPPSLSAPPSFTPISLYKDPEARQLGLDWVTKQLYVHRYAVIDGLRLPIENVMSFDVNLRGDDVVFRLVQRRILPNTTVAIVANAYHRLYERNSFQFGLSGRHVLDNALPGTIYSRDAHENIVYRSFSTAAEFVHVSQTIHDDHVYPTCAKTSTSRTKTAWILVQALDDGRVLETKLFLNARPRMDDDLKTRCWDEIHARANLYLSHFNRDLAVAMISKKRE